MKFDQIDAKYHEFSSFLQTIHSQIPFVKTESEIIELIARVDSFITNNEPRQLEDLKNLAIMSKRIHGYDKTIEIYSSNIELFQAFFTIKSELCGLMDKMRFSEEQKQRQLRVEDERRAQDQLRNQEHQLREKEEQRIREHRLQEESRLQECIRHQEQLRAQEQLWAEKQLHLEQELHAQELLLLEEKRRAQEQQLRLQEQLRQQEVRMQEQLQSSQQHPENHQSQSKCDKETQFNKTVLIQSTESHTITQNNINEYYSINGEAAKQPPIFTMHLCDATVQEGDRCTFKCCVIGYPMPTVEWFKDGISAKINSDYHTSFDNGLCTLSIDETLTEDSAIFICKASNGVGCAETKCRLVVTEQDEANILIPPNFIRLLESCAVVQGSPFELRCKVEGNPLPTVQWFRNTDCIDHTHQHGVTYNNGEAILRFDNVRLNDDAVYTCKASNMIGFDQTSAKLNVIADNGCTAVPNGWFNLFSFIHFSLNF